MQNGTFSAYLIGSESLLIQCAETLLQTGNEVRGVVSDSPQICDWAIGLSMPVVDPRTNLERALQGEPFDFLLSITNFSILPDSVLRLPRRATINFHDGPLPEYSGLNVTTWAIAAGEKRHAISWHVVDSGIDTGDVLVERSFELDGNETAFSLNTRCFEVAIESFRELVTKLSAGDLAGRKQSIDKRRYFGKFHRPTGAGLLDFSESAESIVRLVRSLDFGTYDNPVGTAKFIAADQLVVATGASEGSPSTRPPGTVVSCSPTELVVATATNDVILNDLHRVAADGTFGPANLSTRILPDTKLAAVPTEQLVDIVAADAVASKNDPLTVEVLRDPHPPTLPDFAFPAGSATGVETHELIPALPASVGTGDPQLIVAGLLLTFLSKISDQERVDVRLFTDSAESTAIAGQLFLNGSPSRFEFSNVDDTIESILDRLAKKLSMYRNDSRHSADLHFRYRRLQAASTLQSVELHFGDEARSPGAECNVSFTVSSKGKIWFASNRALISDEAVTSLVKHFRHFSTYAAKHPGLRFRDIGLLERDDYKRVVEAWNDSSLTYEAFCIHDQIGRTAAADPEAVAIVGDREQLTYGELDLRSNQLANRLVARGIRRGDRVGLCVDRSPNMLVGLLGILKAGAAYVPLDPDFPRDRLQYIAQDAAVAGLVCLRKYVGLFSESEAAKIVLEESDWQTESTNPVNSGVTADDLAYVIHTSGSTGNPKGVMVRHRNVANFFVAMDEILLPEQGGAWLAVTSLSFDISVLELLWTLARGFKVIVGAPVKPARETTILEYESQSIDFSLFFFAASSAQVQGQRDQYRLLLESARFADEHGFVAIWSPERHFHSFGGLYPNPAVTNAALATITRNLRLRAGSLVSPLHHPVRIAEEWAMVDNLSGGRVDVSYAAGWQPNDFILKPDNFERRKDIMFEQIELVQRLWEGQSVEFNRADGQPISVSTLPRPVQRTLPVWITAAGNPDTFTSAAEKGYNILTHLLGQSVDELAEKVRLYREAEARAGHSGGKITLMLHTFIGDSVDSVREIVREPMKQYLQTAMNLVKEAAWTFPTFKDMTMTEEGRFSMDHLTDDDREAILDYAFERYFESSGLFGSVESCAPFVDRLKGIGIDEIGCLIDYGVEVDLALSGLPELARLLRESNRNQREPVSVESTNGQPVLSAPFVAGRTEAESQVGMSMYALAAREGVSHLQCTPSMARMLVADEEGAGLLKGLDQFLVGGEALDSDLAREIQAKTDATVTNMYGPTETTVWSTSHTVAGTEDAMPIGRPIANTQVYILGRDGSPLPAGIAGELYIGGDGVTAGYLNREDLTAERFLDNPFAPRGGKMYRTGDLCRFRDDGTIEYLGRNDHQVKVRGYRIELGEIEKTLRRNPAVAEVAVVVEFAGTDSSITAYLVETGGRTFDPATARVDLERSLPPYMIPARFVVLDAFPRTPNGKLDRNALQNQKARKSPAEAVRETIPPADDLETAVSNVWKAVLNVDAVGVTDNFFDIGGHSLLAVQVNARLGDVLGRSLSLIDLFRFPTIRSFAAHISSDSDGRPGEAVSKGTSRAEARRAAMNRRGR